MTSVSQKAVIYFRTATDGHSKDHLFRQEMNCFSYAKIKHYQVASVFIDEGFSGNTLDRPNMQKMLAYLEEHKSEGLVVIVYDLSRLARDVSVHMQLRSVLKEANAKLECVCDVSAPEFKRSH